MNNHYYRVDKDGPCQKTLISILILALALVLPKKIKAQTQTPNPTADVFMSVTFQAEIKGEETPTPIATPSPSPTLAPAPIITPIPEIERIGLKIFGYAPSSTFVSLTGKNTLELTTANDTGYFEFNNVLLPETKGKVSFYPELCLQAYFQEISTQPTCLAPLPVGNKSYNIGPVILSPIITIEESNLYTNSQVKAVGKTTPNTKVLISLAQEEQKTTIINIIEKIKIIKTASAYYLPKYQIISDDNGNFEFNLPTTKSAKWRIFAVSQFQGQNSPKSNTLSFLVLPQSLKLIEKIILLLLSLFSKLFFNLIILEIVIIMILIASIKKAKQSKKANRKSRSTSEE